MTPEEKYTPHLHNYFTYDETSPTCLRWATDRYGGRYYTIKAVSEGDIAGSLSGAGYYDVTLDGVVYKVHLIVWVLNTGQTLNGDCKVDHFDGNSLHNKFDNLRLVTQAVNCRNSKRFKSNTTGHPGVYRFKDLAWTARWMQEGRQMSKSFSIRLYGEERAKTLAILAREAAIAMLNRMQYGYTERHGT